MKTVSRAEQAFLCISKCLVFWTTCLQDGITLSTTKAEHVAILMAMIDLLPFKRLVQTIFRSIEFEKRQKLNILCNLFDDNAGALSLANLELPRMTPRSKHYAAKYNWFRVCLKLENIGVLKVESKRQLADIFVKGFPKSTFENIRELLIGW